MSWCTPQVCRSQTRVLDSPGVRVAGSCEPPDVGVGNQTQILCEGSKCLSLPSASRPGQNDFLLRCGDGTEGSMQGASSTGEPHPAPHSLQHIPGERAMGQALWWATLAIDSRAGFQLNAGVSECPSTCHWQFPLPKTWANKKRNWYFKEKNQIPTPGVRSSWPHRRNGNFKEL